jgi:AraC family transcriptional regulator of adaptative response/methylated-DNA-[protein]-cysteine methyltransferase
MNNNSPIHLTTLLPTPRSLENKQRLFASLFNTPLGAMIAIASAYSLHFLEFIDRESLTERIQTLSNLTQSNIIQGESRPLVSIGNELHAFFAGSTQAFNTPITMHGTPFQIHVWKTLQEIPAGESCAYIELAKRVGRPKAYRAVAQANRMNRLAIIIPCHRVIQHDGRLGGYAGGIHRKAWLLHHERLVKDSL